MKPKQIHLTPTLVEVIANRVITLETEANELRAVLQGAPDFGISPPRHHEAPAQEQEQPRVNNTPRHRPRMSAAARKAVSLRMKRYWKAKRKESA